MEQTAFEKLLREPDFELISSVQADVLTRLLGESIKDAVRPVSVAQWQRNLSAETMGVSQLECRLQ